MAVKTSLTGIFAGWFSFSWKNTLLLVLFACFPFLAASLSRAADGWEPVWSDEFNAEGLPDPAKWGYEEGYVRNGEKQFYTHARKENARVENGVLILEARKEHFPIPGGSANAGGRDFAEYTAASLTTLHHQSWTYGRLEMRAKLPQGKGVWPACWMLGENIAKAGWPACGEIDIMEFVGHDPNLIYGTTHYLVNGKQASDGGHVQTELTRGEFHVYAVNWTSDRIDFFVDDHLYHTTIVDRAGPGKENPLRQPQYLLLNFALGGEWGGPIDDGILPQQYVIDYVRVFKKKD